MSILTKLKYVRVPSEDLVDIYDLMIRSLTEYCSVVWHSRLTVEQTNKLERIQKICLKVILGDSYTRYSEALDMCSLVSLHQRREDRCLNFARKDFFHSTGTNTVFMTKVERNLLLTLQEEMPIKTLQFHIYREG